ncbi:DUF2330 domain-containing protein [candidate division WOR-3 bacterium]|nr:DUF2330 domain-containing protein [candidate division WOR-3 bacterium]
MKKFIFVMIMIILMCVSYADRGSIPFNPNIQIFEPNQRAMIAWNGEEEILLLSTDMYASGKTDVLEVIPLPSEPVVKKGDTEVFKKAIKLINKKTVPPPMHAFDKVATEDMSRQPVGEITFHKKIGSHDVSVAHVIDGEGFIDWVEKYLRSTGIKNPIIPEDLKNVVMEYIEDDFKWFVFDVISLDSEKVTNEAIQYRFKTDYLYYPLKITRTEKDYTIIDLLILTQNLLGNFPGISIDKVSLLHKPVFITSDELMELNEDMRSLFGEFKEMNLRIWQIEGYLSSFKDDLIAY